MSGVIFWVILQLPGNQTPLRFEHPVPTLAECLFETHQFLTKPPHEALIRGGQLQVGCVVTFEPSEEH
jgi:hypothetical protein